jgi:hypothetical protein
VVTPPLRQGKPKRKYTASWKLRAPSLRNLVLANLAPHELKYRLAARYNAWRRPWRPCAGFDFPTRNSKLVSCPLSVL